MTDDKTKEEAVEKQSGERYRFVQTGKMNAYSYQADRSRQRYLAKLYKALVFNNAIMNIYGKRLRYLHPVLGK